MRTIRLFLLANHDTISNFPCSPTTLSKRIRRTRIVVIRDDAHNRKLLASVGRGHGRGGLRLRPCTVAANSPEPWRSWHRGVAGSWLLGLHPTSCGGSLDAGPGRGSGGRRNHSRCLATRYSERCI